MVRLSSATQSPGSLWTATWSEQPGMGSSSTSPRRMSGERCPEQRRDRNRGSHPFLSSGLMSTRATTRHRTTGRGSLFARYDGLGKTASSHRRRRWRRFGVSSQERRLTLRGMPSMCATPTQTRGPRCRSFISAEPTSMHGSARTTQCTSSSRRRIQAATRYVWKSARPHVRDAAGREGLAHGVL